MAMWPGVQISRFGTPPRSDADELDQTDVNHLEHISRPHRATRKGCIARRAKG
jgi:hypothetical protein